MDVVAVRDPVEPGRVANDRRVRHRLAGSGDHGATALSLPLSLQDAGAQAQANIKGTLIGHVPRKLTCDRGWCRAVQIVMRKHEDHAYSPDVRSYPTSDVMAVVFSGRPDTKAESHDDLREPAKRDSAAMNSPYRSCGNANST